MSIYYKVPKFLGQYDILLVNVHVLYFIDKLLYLFLI